MSGRLDVAVPTTSLKNAYWKWLTNHVNPWISSMYLNVTAWISSIYLHVTAWISLLYVLFWRTADYIVLKSRDQTINPRVLANLRTAIILIAIPFLIRLWINLHADNPICAVPGLSTVFLFCKLPPPWFVRHLSAVEISNTFREYLPVIKQGQASQCLSEDPLQAYLQLTDSRRSLRVAFPPVSEQLNRAVQDVESQSSFEVSNLKKFYCGAHEHVTWVESRVGSSAIGIHILGDPWRETMSEKFMRFWTYRASLLTCKTASLCLNTNTTRIIGLLKEYKAQNHKLQALGEQAIIKARAARDRIITLDQVIGQTLEEEPRQDFLSKMFPRFDGHQPYRDVQKELQALETFWSDAINVKIYPQLLVLQSLDTRASSILRNLAWYDATIQPGDLMERELDDVAWKIRREMRRYKRNQERRGLSKFIHNAFTRFVPEMETYFPYSLFAMNW